MSNFQQQPFQPVAKPPTPPKKPMSKEARIAWMVLAGFGIFALGATLGASGGSDPATSAVAGPQPTVTVTVPDNGPTPDPVTTPTNKPSPSAPATTAPKPTVAPKTTAKPKPVVYKKLTARQWALIAKSPDKHVGEAYTVHGVVTQFDSATGDDQFRADVDGVKHLPEYGYVDYPTNTLMTNISGDLSDLVQDDLFTAKVVVVGSYSYDTQIGGETTVPQLSVISITVTGSVK
ncbi:hypothetical protein [Streptomyces sp.]|uniref:hypothetical protein n=1 Tax=Streptomyces sp. TaxID=1931 RepID=UPI002F95B83E